MSRLPSPSLPPWQPPATVQSSLRNLEHLELQLARYPYVREWDAVNNPLPMMRFRANTRHRGRVRSTSPSLVQQNASADFDFCRAMRHLCVDITRRCPAFQHIQVDRVLFATAQARNSSIQGLQARVTPLRFPSGRLFRRRSHLLYQVQRYVLDGREMLYVITFFLPRFLDQRFEEKLITVFHELYHISPKFDGDLRRLGDRYCMHSHSKKSYDIHMAQMSRAYLLDGADLSRSAFLKHDFATLQSEQGQLMGVSVPRPKLIPLHWVLQRQEGWRESMPGSPPTPAASPNQKSNKHT